MTDIAQRGNRLTRTGYAKGGRAGHATGAIVKGGVKAGKRFLDFIKSGKHVDKHGVKVNVPKVVKRLKKQGSPHLETYKESMKAEGGRIGKAGGGWTPVIPKGPKEYGGHPKGPFKKPKGVHPGFTKENMYERRGGGEKGKPHSSKEGRIAAGARSMQRSRKFASDAIKKWKKKKTGPVRQRKPYNKS